MVTALRDQQRSGWEAAADKEAQDDSWRKQGHSRSALPSGGGDVPNTLSLVSLPFLSCSNYAQLEPRNPSTWPSPQHL